MIERDLRQLWQEAGDMRSAQSETIKGVGTRNER